MQKILPTIFLFLFVLIPTTSLASDNVLLDQGIAQYRAENYEEALELLLKARQTAPSAAVSYYLGLTYKSLEMHQEAKAQFLACLEQQQPVQEAYVELAETLYILGELDAAGEWLNKAGQAGARPAQIQFLSGLLLSKEGRYDESLDAFSRAKGLDASLVRSADFQSALVLIRMRRYEDARKGLQAIAAMDPTSDFASFALEYDKALAKTIEDSRKWIITAGLSYQYDDNVLLKPSGDIPGIDITGEADSSIVAALGIVSPSLESGRWSVNGRYNFYSKTHFSLNSHDLITNTVSLNPLYSMNKATVSFPLSYSHIWLDQKQYMGLFSFRPSLQALVSPGNIIQMSAGYSRHDMVKPPVDPDEDRDADIYTASAGYIRPFNQGSYVFNMIYEFSRQKTSGKNWENRGHRFTAGLLSPFFRSDLKLILSGDIFLQDYDNVNTIFDIKRQDRLYTGTANLRWEAGKRFTMNFQYSHTTADSNIFVYDYSRNIVTLGMELRF